MSTAGKVLSVFVLLSILAWTVLGAIVAESNYQGNSALHKLEEEVAKHTEDVAKNRQDFVALRDQTTLAQETLTRQLAVLHAKQNDLEKARSQILDTLSDVKYGLETVQATIQSARATLDNRTVEARDEEKALADTRAQVKSLDDENGQLMARLQSLRDQFKSTYRTNAELAGTRK